MWHCFFLTAPQTLPWPSQQWIISTKSLSLPLTDLSILSQFVWLSLSAKMQSTSITTRLIIQKYIALPWVCPIFFMCSPPLISRSSPPLSQVGLLQGTRLGRSMDWHCSQDCSWWVCSLIFISASWWLPWQWWWLLHCGFHGFGKCLSFLLHTLVTYSHPQLISSSNNIFDNLPDLTPTSFDLCDKLELYLSTDTEDIKDATSWWYVRCATFPSLSCMAQDYLSIPGKWSIDTTLHAN